MGTPSREISASIDLLADAIRGLHDLDVAKVGESLGDAHAKASIATEKLSATKASVKQYRKEIQSLRTRTKLFDACIEVYHEAIKFYADTKNWTMVIDPGQTEATHAIKHGWQRAEESLTKATRYSEAVAEHYRQRSKLDGTTGLEEEFEGR